MSWKIAVASQLILLTLAFHGQASASAPCIAPPTGLVSWWTGDVDTTDLYGVNDPSAVNAISLVPAEVLDGFTFGTGGYIDIPPSPTLANQKFTWDAWVKPEGPGPINDAYGSVIISQIIDFSDGTVELFWRANPDYRFLFLFGNIGSEFIVSNDTFPPGAFYLVAGTYDGATFRLYVNGVLEGSFAEKKKIAYSSSTWGIGSEDAAARAAGGGRTFNGVIDEVEAFKVALPASKILSIFKAGSAGKCKDPVVVTPASETFAPQAVDTTSPAKTVMILNNRNATITIDDFAFTGTDPADFAEPSTTCGSTLAARKTCKVSVTFTPGATGKRSAVLDVNDSAAGSPQTADLSGTGTVQAKVSPVSLTFAAQKVGTTSAAKNVTLTNNLSTALTISSITFKGANPSEFAAPTNSCGASLAAKSHCTISVNFTPAATGTRTATMNVSDSANDSPQTVKLSGTGK